MQGVRQGRGKGYLTLVCVCVCVSSVWCTVPPFPGPSGWPAQVHARMPSKLKSEASEPRHPGWSGPCVGCRVTLGGVGMCADGESCQLQHVLQALRAAWEASHGVDTKTEQVRCVCLYQTRAHQVCRPRRLCVCVGVCVLCVCVCVSLET